MAQQCVEANLGCLWVGCGLGFGLVVGCGREKELGNRVFWWLGGFWNGDKEVELSFTTVTDVELLVAVVTKPLVTAGL